MRTNLKKIATLCTVLIFFVIPVSLAVYYFNYKGVGIKVLIWFLLLPLSIGITLVRVMIGEEKYLNFFGGKEKITEFNNSMLFWIVPLTIFAVIFGFLLASC